MALATRLRMQVWAAGGRRTSSVLGVPRVRMQSKARLTAVAGPLRQMTHRAPRTLRPSAVRTATPVELDYLTPVRDVTPQEAGDAKTRPARDEQSHDGSR
jgi:hypothetical protein